ALFLGLAQVGCDRPTTGEPVVKAPESKSPPDLHAAKPETKPQLEGDREAAYAGVVVKPTTPQDPSPFRFAEIAQSAGIDFKHFSGMTEAKHFPTANGSGVAFLDYDGDGKLDIYFATATLLPPGTAKS